MARSAPPGAAGDVAPGFFGNVRADAVAGFVVFLFALPVWLAVAGASGFPPLAGLCSAAIGGLITPFVCNAQLSVKGPAAGLILVVAGAVSDLGAEYGRAEGLPEREWGWAGYRLTLGIGVTAGVVQALFGLLRAGRLADRFPLTAVHGTVAGVGVLIVVRQAYEVLGVSPPRGGGLVALIAEFPQRATALDVRIATVGGLCLIILFGLPVAVNRVRSLRWVPAPLAALAAAVAIGDAPGLDLPLWDRGPTDVRATAAISRVFGDPSVAFATPDFRGLASPTGLKYLLLFSLIGSLQSLLAGKSVELLDPWRRKTNFDRDLFAVGLANTLTAAAGGLPMAAEIATSKANVAAGARSRAASFGCGLCLLACVVALPPVTDHIPRVALAAVLVYAGVRLATPREFVRRYRVGSAQFVVFVGTIVLTQATDLLTGLVIGAVLEALFLVWKRSSPAGGLAEEVGVVPLGDDTVILVVKRAAALGNWLAFRDLIEARAAGRSTVVIDLSNTRPVDHGVEERLRELMVEFENAGQSLRLLGLSDLRPLAGRPEVDRRPTRAPRLPTSAA